MHHLHSQRSVSRFRLVAMLLLCNRLLIAVAPVLLIYSLTAGDSDLTNLALGLVAAILLVTIVQWVGAARLRCPLCHGSPLAHSFCVKNRHARRLLGSYRLRVALSIMKEASFRCPFWGECTAIQARRRPHG